MIIAFFGTKGGTGTTTMAVNCAANLQRLSRQSTVLVDAHPGPGDVAVLLGLRPRYSILELIDQMGWGDPAHARRFLTEHSSGVHVLAASESFGRPGERDAESVEQTLRCLGAMYDDVVIDAGSTLSAPAVAALAVSDVVMLVANPDVPCLRHLQRLTDALRLAYVMPERVRLVLNRMSDHGLRVAEIERVVNRRIDFQIPSDYRTVAAAANAGMPVGALRPTELQSHLESLARAFLDASRAAAAS